MEITFAHKKCRKKNDAPDSVGAWRNSFFALETDAESTIYVYTTVAAKAGPYITDYQFPRQPSTLPSRLETREQHAHPPDGSIRSEQVQNFLEHAGPLLANVRSQQRCREGGVVETAQVNRLQRRKKDVRGGGSRAEKPKDSLRIHIYIGCMRSLSSGDVQWQLNIHILVFDRHGEGGMVGTSYTSRASCSGSDRVYPAFMLQWNRTLPSTPTRKVTPVIYVWTTASSTAALLLL